MTTVNEMDWQQKAEALNALAQINILLRKREDWYVSQSVEIKQKSVLCGAFGNGESPEAAINDHWRQLVDELPDNEYLVTRAYTDKRIAVRWNGYRWAEVIESK